MTAMTGFWCLIASRFKLGVLADFLSRPILMGLLNGVAITIMVSQLSKIFGFTFSERYLIERILNGTDYITQTHLPTLAMSLTGMLSINPTTYSKAGFTAADVAVGYALLLAQHLGLVEQFGPATQAYWQRLQARPGYQRAMAAQTRAAEEQDVPTTPAPDTRP